MRTYHAEVSRDGKFWLVCIPEIGRSTQALRYKDVPIMAGELIEIMEGLESGDYNLHLNVILPSSVEDHLARAEALREEAERKTTEAVAEQVPQSAPCSPQDCPSVRPARFWGCPSNESTS